MLTCRNGINLTAAFRGACVCCVYTGAVLLKNFAYEGFQPVDIFYCHNFFCVRYWANDDFTK